MCVCVCVSVSVCMYRKRVGRENKNEKANLGKYYMGILYTIQISKINFIFSPLNYKQQKKEFPFIDVQNILWNTLSGSNLLIHNKRFKNRDIPFGLLFSEVIAHMDKEAYIKLLAINNGWHFMLFRLLFFCSGGRGSCTSQLAAPQ